jgi:23S rRNA pseudouridine1911/1915/1917 synthase
MYKEALVTQEYHGQRLDSVLASLLPEFSRSQLSHWIKKGYITKNANTCKPKDKALFGDLLAMQVEWTEDCPDFQNALPEEIPLDIVYEDKAVIVLNKPAGLVVHPGAGNRTHTLVNALLNHAPALMQVPRAGIIHRLDKDTTGLLIVAKTLQAHTALIRQMQARQIHRQYLTLVHHQVKTGKTIETGFARHPKNRLKMAVCGQGRQAITHFTINKQYQDFTLLEVQLMTGRTHQIRVHMQYINHPVVGDPLYGHNIRLPSSSSEAVKILLQSFKRQALHACQIGFLHPDTEKYLTFQAPLPDDFLHLLQALDHELL